LVLHNGTSVALEAMASGVPQILVKSDIWFDMVYEGLTDDAQTCVGSPDAIRSAVMTILNEDARTRSDRINQARAKVRELFLPVNEEDMWFLTNLVLNREI
jgi:hypothetical protein